MNPAEYAFEQAVMAIRAGRRQSALDILAEVVRLNHNHADAWSLRARMEADSGRPFNAVLHHAIATQLAPDRHDLWCNRGIDCAGARMFKESEQSFKRALDLQDSFEG